MELYQSTTFIIKEKAKAVTLAYTLLFGIRAFHCICLLPVREVHLVLEYK